MIAVCILLLLIVVLFFGVEMFLRKISEREADRLAEVKAEYDVLAEEAARLKDENSALQETLAKTVAMYELTKQICKSLDEEKVFKAFKEHLARFIEFKDCRLLKPDADMTEYKTYSMLPLEIDSKLIGYLATEGIKSSAQEIFLILAHQFILGIKRVFLYNRIQELAIIDSLTGAFTRNYYLERFEEELARSQKFNYKFSYLMVDIDGFKGFNDNYGHLVGDAILREISGLIKEKIRQIDSLGRCGGDEFLVILPETDAQGAAFAAERIRQAIQDKSVKAYDEELKVTVSIGVSTFPENGKDNSTLIDNADKALYQAKQAGRNRIAVFH
ncbi:MAG: GGDEF domain-containing protein [Candidatus Omnitrophica bacterium]|nr:GGDEF domain-containing protein [Candidatus Omnitrophota bacterium]